MGTPTEEDWPGVSSFPDYKSSFPNWKPANLKEIVSSLDREGLDLLESLLAYDPAARISAKMSLQHPYFSDGFNGYNYTNGTSRPNKEF